MRKQLTSMFVVGFLSLLFISSCTATLGSTMTPSTPTVTNTETLISTVALTMGSDDSPVTCKDAANYLINGELVIAQQAYQAILDATPMAKCAIEGSTFLNSLLTPTITATPTMTPTPTATPNAATVVPALLKAGDFSGAYDTAKVGILADPKIEPSLNQIFLNWYFIKNFSSSFLFPFLTVVLIILVVIYMLRKYRKIYHSTQLDIKTFSSGTYVIDEKIMGALGESICSRMELFLNRWFETELNSITALVITPICLPDLPSVVPSQISSFWTFIIKLFPPPVLSVEGLLEQNSNEGIGLSIKIIDEKDHRIKGFNNFWSKKLALVNLKSKNKRANNKIQDTAISKIELNATQNESDKSKESTETISNSETNQDFDKSTIFALADIAAAWVFWKYCEILKLDLIQYFGTNSFESYLWYVRSGNFDCDIKFLDYSLEKDHRNTLALLNKAKVNIQKFRISKIPITWEQLNENCINLLKQVIFLRKYDIDAMKVTAYYLLGVIHLEKSIQEINPNKTIGKIDHLPDMDNYLQYFENAYFEINKIVKNKKSKKNYGNLLSESFIQAAQLPFIGFMIWKEPLDQQWFKKFRKIESNQNHACSTLYNLACAYNRFSLSCNNPMIKQLIDTFNPMEHYPYQNFRHLVAKHKIPDQSKKALQIALTYFEEACKANPKMADAFNNGESSDESFKFMRDVFPAEFDRIIGKKLEKTQEKKNTTSLYQSKKPVK